ncbi:putative serine dehydratase domain [Lyophyllum shimeji]|uniref:D-serine dehydratase n=1 Tax=Lyophyllum shimeji TaxID=47721 RepID=A0A9P3PIT6_LYOSH|nr:putative serine dehydratase domain [Lyophyllum shimeji]
MATQTRTPHQLSERPKKAALVKEFLDKPLNALRTPAMVIDRTLFAENCASMHSRAKTWGASFRAHLKTHKTVEGTRLQLQSTNDRTQAVVVSTLMEAWEVVNAGLVSDQIVKDILYGFPVPLNKIADLSDLWDEVSKYDGTIRLLVDHPEQVKFLEQFESSREKPRRWSVFVKVDGGQRRAGVSPDSPLFRELLSLLFSSPATSVYGFYVHAGNSYAAKSPSQASSFLSAEVEAVNTAAEAALAALNASSGKEYHQQPFVLSVGATPTAHAASAETRRMLSSMLHGVLELHAGNYPLLDLQQRHTGMIDEGRIAQRVLATVVSYYPGRGEAGEDEALIDAGAIAFSKDTGPSGGYGDVIGMNWRIGRMAQEHGILTRIDRGASDEKLEVGSLVEIVGQHACLIAAAYPWYYIVDKNVEQGTKVVDIWVPWKGW